VFRTARERLGCIRVFLGIETDSARGLRTLRRCVQRDQNHEAMRILADLGISIDAMIQKEPAEGEEQADVILLTHETVEKHINQAIAKIEALSSISGKVTRIRLEELSA
jgi:radical SAM superfamily enzyme YgiQ (UPF0313 family)